MMRGCFKESTMLGDLDRAFADYTRAQELSLPAR
jgi:hypothetical protein